MTSEGNGKSKPPETIEILVAACPAGHGARMRTRPGVAELFLALSLSGFGALVACGSRTGLFVLEEKPGQDAAPPPEDTLQPPEEDVVVSIDTLPPPMDAPFDVLPPIDVAPLPDVFVNDCPDAGSTFVYVVTETNQLYSFYPPTGAFTQIGLLACPAAGGAEPFSMAVDKQGTAFVVFSDGELFQVSTKTAACIATGYAPDQMGFATFGMGYVGNPSGNADTLFIAADNGGSPTNPIDGTLGTIDTTSFTLSVVGNFNPQTVSEAELTGTGDGRLFTFYGTEDGNSSAVAQIDPNTATVLANNNLTNLPQGNGWAFAFWGGQFYLFTAPGPGGSQVTQFNPTTLSQTTVAMLPDVIVGAGVSTCAPMN